MKMKKIYMMRIERMTMRTIEDTEDTEDTEGTEDTEIREDEQRRQEPFHRRRGLAKDKNCRGSSMNWYKTLIQNEIQPEI